jgi:hypothetical protein
MIRRERFPGERAFAALEQDPFYKAFFSRRQPETRLEGNTLINERYHCRITLPEGVESLPGFDRHSAFHLMIGDLNVYCQAVRPDSLGQLLQMPAGVEVTGDEKFMVGPLPARQITRTAPTPNGRVSYSVYLIQAPRVVFHIMLASRENAQPEHAALLRRVVESFRMDE